MIKLDKIKNLTPNGNGVFGFQNNKVSNPFALAPEQEAGGGIVFFDSSNDKMKEKLFGLFSLLDVDEKTKKYYVFIKNSLNPQKDGYLQQMRIISDFAMEFLFKFKSEEKTPEQPLNIPNILYHFTQTEIEKWGNSFFKNKGLWGKFGGDGYMAKEQLSFGFMIENDYHGVYRIWSRAWLVTK